MGKKTPWWADNIGYTLECLGSDLEEGNGNGASLPQARLFLKRLEGAVSRAPKVQREVSPHIGRKPWLGP